MSPLGQRISDWLKSFPGLIEGDTMEELFAKAHKMAKLEATTVSPDDLRAALDRVGYIPRARGDKLVLVLPEKPSGW